jgi:hypothetical protein
MKHLSILLVFLVACHASPKAGDKAFPSKQSLRSPFEVFFIAGHEEIYRSKLKVYDRDNTVWASIAVATYNYGENPEDEEWQVQLNEEEIDLCNAFLKNAKKVSQPCIDISGGFTYHKITTATDTIKIKGWCEWRKVDYNTLETKILEKKYTAFTDAFQGKWYVMPPSRPLTSGDTLILRKVADVFNKDCFWDFSPAYSFRRSCTALPGLTIPDSSQFSFALQNNSTCNTLIIHAASGNNKETNPALEYAGESFCIISMDARQILLRY